MCNCTRHKTATLSSEFCEMWEKMDALLETRNKELTDLKQKNGAIVKAYKKYRAEYKEIMEKWQLVYEPMWEEFDDKFNQDVRG